MRLCAVLLLAAAPSWATMRSAPGPLRGPQGVPPAAAMPPIDLALHGVDLNAPLPVPGLDAAAVDQVFADIAAATLPTLPATPLGASLEAAETAAREQTPSALDQVYIGTARGGDADAQAVQAQAERPGQTALPQLLALKTQGWEVWPAGSAPDAVEASVRAHSDRLPREANGRYDSLVLYNTKGWHRDFPQLRPADREGLDQAPVQALTREITARVREALPGEAFDLVLVSVRRAAGTVALGDEAHVDGGYLTATLAYGEPEEAAGAGTVLYFRRGGRIEEVRIPAGAIGIISGDEREEATGRQGTMHGAPPERALDRRLLILKYRAAAFASEHIIADIKDREAAFRTQLARQRAAAQEPPARTGWLRRLWRRG